MFLLTVSFQVVDVVNIIASGDLGREFDLRSLLADLDADEKVYQPERSPALQIRFDESCAVTMLYTTGSYNIMGAKNKSDLDRAYKALIGALNDLGINTTDSAMQPKISNLVCKANLDREVNLSELTIALGVEHVEYEPEQSPFVYYYPENFDCLLTIPNSGKVAITGVENTEEAADAFKHLRNQIDELFGDG